MDWQETIIVAGSLINRNREHTANIFRILI
jgi:hypothetical protein